MPVMSFNNAITAHLSSISFSRPEESFLFSPRNTLKNTLNNGNGVDFYVLDHNRFKVSIQPQRYYEALATDFYYSIQKVRQQRLSIVTQIESDTAGAWILVSAYYQAFYAAIELSRLIGRYNTSFDESHIEFINLNNSTSNNLEKGGPYKGEVSLNHDGDIEIYFSSDGSKPHLHTWKNIKDIIVSQNFQANITNKNVKRINRLKEIVDHDIRKFPTPSELRNEWNYAKAQAYAPEIQKEFKLMKKLLLDEDFSHVKSWADKPVKEIGDSERFSSISYISNILSSTLESSSSKLIG